MGFVPAIRSGVWRMSMSLGLMSLGIPSLAAASKANRQFVSISAGESEAKSLER